MSGAVGAGIRTFDLYDFFSVFIPGATLIIGAYPLFPTSLNVSALAALLPVLVGGFVIGRAIHSGAVRVEEVVGTKTHQEQFIEELGSPEILTPGMVNTFYEKCRSTFDIGLTPDRENFDITDDQLCSALYTAVRAYIHIDSRGRSRSFQALYAFYRSMWLVSILLGLLYVLYLVTLITPPAVSFPYNPYIVALQTDAILFFYIPIALGLGGYTTFRHAKAKYRKIYTRYLIGDFISLTTSN